MSLNSTVKPLKPTLYSLENYGTKAVWNEIERLKNLGVITVPSYVTKRSPKTARDILLQYWIKPKQEDLDIPNDCVIPLIKLNDICNTTHINILKSCLIDIVNETFGIREWLFFLSTHFKTNKDKLQSIIKTITDKKVSSLVPETETNGQQSYLIQMSSDCCSHIVAYLNKNDIESLKLCSRRIGLLCLEEMKKIPIGVLSDNNLSHPDEKFNLYKLNENNVIWSRHSTRKKYHSLYDEWYKQYNVSEENQLLYRLAVSSRAFGVVELVNTNNIRINSIQKDLYLLINAQRTIVFDNKNSIMPFTKNIFDVVKNYRLMILEYFSIHKQQTSIVQFILYKPDVVSFTDIFEYIEKKFIPMDGINNEWYNELNSILKRMFSDKNCPKLVMYSHNKWNSQMQQQYPNSFPTQTLFTFQLNIKHPWFNQNDIFTQSKLIYKQQLRYFYNDAFEFCSSTCNVFASFIGNKSKLKSSIKKFYKSELNRTEQKVFKCDLKAILYVIDNGMKISMDSLLNSGVLRVKISKLLGNIIEPRYIELLSTRPIQWNDRICDKLGRSGNIRISYNIVGYDARFVNNINNDEQMYNIRIFDPAHSYLPCAQKSKILTIWYRKEFIIKDLFAYLFSSIYTSRNRLLHLYCEDVLNKYYEIKQETEDSDDVNREEDPFPSMNDRIKCLLKTQKHEWISNNLPQIYGCEHVINMHTHTIKNQFDLFMVQNKTGDPSRNIALKIKFINAPRWDRTILTYKTNIENVKELKYIGLPLVVWINKFDTLQDVIDKYLMDYKNVLGFCYYAKAGRSIKTIFPSLRDKCKPSKFCAKDFIIFKVHGGMYDTFEFDDKTTHILD